METIPTKKKPLTLYVIQRKRDSAYSRGGDPVKWGKHPKTWGIGPFKNHLLQFKPCRYYKKAFPYIDCEVLVIDPETLGITDRFAANEWAWHNCYLLYWKKEEPRWARQGSAKTLNESFEEWKKEYL